ncbi:MAG TPA: beta-N-acetylhexosaminidase [Dongiaceae bacterium]|nr:beta-N-acetylhexosaminidase [Dongiaceae bacterium]
MNPPVSLLRLESDFAPTPSSPDALVLRLHNGGATALAGFKLAVNGMFLIDAAAGLSGGDLVEQLSYHHVIAPSQGFVLAPGATWTVTARRIATDPTTKVPNHYTYGPRSAYLALADGSVQPIAVAPTTRGGVAGRPARTPPPLTTLPAGEAPIAVIPHPRSVAVSGACDAAAPLALVDGPDTARRAFQSAKDLAARLFGDTQPLFADTGTRCVAQIEPMADEAYRIVFATDAITVRAASRTGFLYAFVTLGQMLRGARARPAQFVLPARGEIEDAPRFGWRGMLFDLSRRVYGIDALHRAADLLAWHKLNRLHLHLTDDEGWRLEIPAYPELGEIAGWRGHGLALPPLFGSPAERHGAVYSPADIAGLVAHADSLSIVAVPEIDVPGHSYATLCALPQLKDPGETGAYRDVHHYANNALNPAVEATYTFLETVFGTVADLFPAPLIHIGGDEVAKGAWLGSPLARALMQKHGWTETAQLQSHFLQRVQAIINRLGRKTGAWEEAAQGGGIDARDSCLFAWTRPESGFELAKSGYDVILMPGTRHYLDMAQGEDWWEPGAAWAGTVPLELTYRYDPGGDWPAELRPRLKGVEAALWGEPLGREPGLIAYLLFPRLSAVAETAWTPAGRKNLTRFLAMQDLIPRPEL